MSKTTKICQITVKGIQVPKVPRMMSNLPKTVGTAGIDNQNFFKQCQNFQYENICQKRQKCSEIKQIKTLEEL